MASDSRRRVFNNASNSDDFDNKSVKTVLLRNKAVISYCGESMFNNKYVDYYLDDFNQRVNAESSGETIEKFIQYFEPIYLQKYRTLTSEEAKKCGRYAVIDRAVFQIAMFEKKCPRVFLLLFKPSEDNCTKLIDLSDSKFTALCNGSCQPLLDAINANRIIAKRVLSEIDSNHTLILKLHGQNSQKFITTAMLETIEKNPDEVGNPIRLIKIDYSQCSEFLIDSL